MKAPSNPLGALEATDATGRFHMTLTITANRAGTFRIVALASRCGTLPNVLPAMVCSVAVISAVTRAGHDGSIVQPRRSRRLQRVWAALSQTAISRTKLAANAPAVLERSAVDKVAAMWIDL
jgi:hypothetical protein